MIKNRALRAFYYTFLIDKDLLAISLYGSQLYGTTNSKSDYDYIVITNEHFYWSGDEACVADNFDIHFYGHETFNKKIQQHDIAALECLWAANENDFIKNIRSNYKVNLSLLRHSISEKASNSWVKAKKKIEKEKDFYIGKKSLWHSLRIIMFGIQIANHGKIVNYQEANYLYDQIVNSPIDQWNYFNGKYKSLYNSLMTNFRLVAPK